MESLICRHCGAKVLPELEEMPCQNCKADSLFRFLPADWPRTFRGVLRELQWDNASVAEAFGYKNANSFAASSAAPVMREGLMRVYYATRLAGNGCVYDVAVCRAFERGILTAMCINAVFYASFLNL